MSLPPFERSLLLVSCIVSLAMPAHAATTVRLPNWVCARPDALFIDGFQTAAAVTRLPSNGVGGALGNSTRAITIAGLGTQSVHVHVPPSYSPTQPMPLVLALHGQAGSAAAAESQAQAVRTAWATVADAQGFIVIAPVGTGASGSWSVPPPAPSDYDAFAAAIADAESAWNIDRSRRIGWGFSAGGHVMHDIVLNDFSSAITIDTFAAYAISAGTLAGLACQSMSTTACDAIVAGATRRIPIDFHVGTSDPLFAQTSADSDRFLANGWVDSTTLWFTPFPGGHTYASSQFAQIWTNLCPFQVLP
jgi:poly(3-hydroxybutyrate) depolymerase